VRSPDRPASSLVALEPETQRISPLITMDGDIDHPVFLSSDELAFSRVVHGNSVLLVLSPSTGKTNAMPFQDGHAELMPTLVLGRLVFVNHIGTRTPRGLFRVSLDGGEPQLVTRQPGYPAIVGVEPERILIRDTAGAGLHSYLWKPTQTIKSPGMVIRIPGPANADSERSRFSGTVQYVIRQGHYAVVLGRVPYDSVEGTLPGKVREASLRQIDGILDFAHTRLKIPPERIVLWGSSVGAVLAIETAARRPHAVGALLLQGVPAMAARKDTHTHLIVAAFHGEFDDFSPLQARALLSRVFGDRALQEFPGRFEIVPYEGHGLRRRTSRARMAAALIQMLSWGQARSWRPLSPPL
jgi:pimeloyl-ACP methyl ester carboxylesterase